MENLLYNLIVKVSHNLHRGVSEETVEKLNWQSEIGFDGGQSFDGFSDQISKKSYFCETELPKHFPFRTI